MKRGRKIAIYFAGGLLLNAGLRASEPMGRIHGPVVRDNPYAAIVTRNVFDLNPPERVTAVAEPPPKITLTGIMSEFGHLQVLFKAATPPKFGKPAVESSYILGENKRQDDIEVVHIDDKSNIVTFNNHGVVQEIPLSTAPIIAFTPNTAPVPVHTLNLPSIGASSGGGSAVVNIGEGNHTFGNHAFGQHPLNNGSYGGSSFGGGTTGVGSSQSGNASQQTMSAAAQMAQIELDRIAHQNEINNGTYPPPPPTALTPPGATGADGQPLIAPPPVPGK